MYPDPLDQVPKIRRIPEICIILGCTILILIFPSVPVMGYPIPGDIQDRLKSAFPTATEATTGLDFSQSPGIHSEDNQDNYYYVTYGWKGYKRFTCPPDMKDGRIDKNPGDFFSADIMLNYIDNPASAQTLTSAEVFRTWIKGRVEPYTDYPDLPGGVIHEEIRNTDYYLQVEDWIAFWYDPHTYGEVRVSASVRVNPLYDSNKCQPQVSQREQEIRTLVESEAERLAKLVSSRLSGGTAAEPDLKTGAENRLAAVSDLYEKWNGAFNDYITGNAQSYAGGEPGDKTGATGAELQAQAIEFERDTMNLFKVNPGTELFESAASLITNTPQYSGYEAELWRRTKENMEAKIAAGDYGGAITVYDEAMAADRKMNEGWFGKSGINPVKEENILQDQNDATVGTVTQKTETTRTGKTFSY